MSENAYKEKVGTLPLSRLSKTDIHLLAVFVRVVEAGGFSAAQVALNVGQSTISRQMSDLEHRLGMRLCQRGRVGFRITDKGRLVHEACRTLFVALEDFRSEIGAISGQLVGELSLAVIDNWATDDTAPLAPALRDFKKQGPNVRIDIQSLAPDDIESSVLDGRVNAGIGVFHRHKPGLDYARLYDDTVELYCGEAHPLFAPAREGQVPHDLDKADLVRRGYLAEEQVSPGTAHLGSSATAHQIEGVAFMILAGTHVGYMPKSYASFWVDRGRMASLLPERLGLKTPIELATRKGVVPTLVTRTFCDLLKARALAANSEV